MTAIAEFYGQHWTDTRIGRDVAGQIQRRRPISNFRNHQMSLKMHNGIWAPSTRVFETDASKPDEWEGEWDFRHRMMHGSAELFWGDTTDPINQTLVGIRYSRRPDWWINFKCVDATGGAGIVEPHGERVRWVDVWRNCDLSWNWRSDGLRKIIKCKAPGHPDSFKMSVRIPEGATYTVRNNSLDVFDSEGTHIFKTKKFEAWDSSPAWPGAPKASSATPGGRRIRLTMTEAAPLANGDAVIEITPNPADVAASTYPLYIDPTDTITDTTNTEDAYLRSGASGFNYGGAVLHAWGTNVEEVHRVLQAPLPAGTYTTCTFELYVESYTTGQRLNAHIIADGNTWTEGTLNHASGVCSWDERATTTNWLGSAGCATATTDFDATEEDNDTATGTGRLVWTLTNSKLEAMRDGGRSDDGLILKPNGTDPDETHSLSERGSNKPEWIIVYTVPSGTPFYYNLQNQMRRRG